MVLIKKRGGELFCEVNISLDSTGLELKKAIHKLKPRMYVSRQRLTFESKASKTPIVVSDEKTLGDQGIVLNTDIVFKDLGPQLAYRTVYFTEYLFPLLVYPMFALRIFPVYGANPRPLTVTQWWALLCWSSWSIKRVLETLFVHEFGNLTMPFHLIFKNCSYYGGFSFLVGYYVNSPDFDARLDWQPWRIFLGVGLFFFFMICNGICHLQLKFLRPPGTTAWKIPRGFLFEYVSFPNYFCEILTWLAFNFLTGLTISGLLFNICGAGQMWVWARARHRKYHRDFPNYPKNRKIIIPFIL